MKKKLLHEADHQAVVYHKEIRRHQLRYVFKSKSFWTKNNQNKYEIIENLFLLNLLQAMSLPTIEDWQLPNRYRRKPLDPVEIEYINRGGPA